MVHRCSIISTRQYEKSYGSCIHDGKGEIIISPTKEKINLQSSIESELIGVDEKISKVLYMNHFQECQVFSVQLNIIYQDNTSSIKLEDNS